MPNLYIGHTTITLSCQLICLTSHKPVLLILQEKKNLQWKPKRYVCEKQDKKLTKPIKH